MAKAQRKPVPEEAFLKYFGMRRQPFGPPADPLEIFDCEQYNLLYERLVRATEYSGRLAVICGVDGSGKTTLLNRFVANLPENTVFARFDETCKTGKQFYFDFLTQLGFDEISGTLREFRNITREFLIYKGTASHPVLILVDNAHLVKPSVLEQLRWISATKTKDAKVVSLVLVGNLDLPRIMESPAMRSLKFDDRTDFNIRVYTESETDAYVSHCLHASGGADEAKFSSTARAMIYRYTGGIPAQINALCSAALAEACVRENGVIHDELIRAVADKEKMLPHAVPLKSKGRRTSDANYVGKTEAEPDEERTGNSKAERKGTTGTQRKATVQLTADFKKDKPATKKAKADLREARVLIESLEMSLAERDSRIAELTATLDTYASDLMNVQAQLSAHTEFSDKRPSPDEAVLSIEVLKNGNCEQIVDIGQDQSRVMIGRAEDSELRLGGQFVSRHHALIVLSNGEVFIEDLKSFNGTIVNGSRISRRKINGGDKINIGDYELRTNFH